MADYQAVTRSNYFRVTDPDRLKEIVKNTITGSNTLALLEKSQGAETFYGFAAHASITGLPENPNGSDSDDKCNDLFLAALQDILNPGDAIIITEIGYEGLRYLVGVSTIITKESIIGVDLQAASLEAARKALGQSHFITKLDY